MDDVKRRAVPVLSLVQMGELSAGRQALEGADIALGNNATLPMLQDPRKRPPRTGLGDEIPRAVMEHVAQSLFDLEEKRFLGNFRISRRGAAPRQSGMNAGHVRPVLDTCAL